MKFDDTRSARIHCKEKARSKKAKTESVFSPGRSIFVTERGNPFATFGGVVDEVTNAGRVIALIDIFGRLTPVEFEPKQLTPAA
jgi:transcription termination/antitermination protein NusG